MDATDPLVPVMDRYAKGYPAHPDGGPPAAYVPLSEALTTEIPWDAHFAAYSVPSIERRLGMNEDREGGNATIWDVMPDKGIPVVLFVLDVEPPAHAPPTPEWLDAEGSKLKALLERHAGGYVYTTRGGYRVLWTLPEPFIIKTRLDSARWRATYGAWLSYVESTFKIEADDSCADWTRLYRLPRVVRDNEAQRPETYGDPNKVGAWFAEVAIPDVHAPPARVEVDEPEWDERAKLYLHEATMDEWRRSLCEYATRRRSGSAREQEQAALVDRILAGEALTTTAGLAGRGRHNTVYRAAQILGSVLPAIGPEAAAYIMKPAIEAIGNLEPKGLDHYLDKVKTDYVSGVRYRRECEERQRLLWESFARAAGRLP